MARDMFSLRSIGVMTVAVLAVSFVALHGGQPPGAAVPLDTDDIAGVVTGPDGPEAGVWVIAETRDLPTRHIKIVVTDDQGRYPRPRSAARHLRRVGARLWLGGLRAGTD